MAAEDTALTRITQAVTVAEAHAVCTKLSIGVLRAVADLCYAVDYPEDEGRAVLTQAVLREARGVCGRRVMGGEICDRPPHEDWCCGSLPRPVTIG